MAQVKKIVEKALVKRWTATLGPLRWTILRSTMLDMKEGSDQSLPCERRRSSGWASRRARSYL